MQNIDDFNRGVTLIMAALYQSFPETVVINPNNIDRHEDIPGDVQRIQKRHTIYLHTVRFLTDEGYIRHKEDDHAQVFSKTVLTSKGLAAMNKTPAVLAEKRHSVGDLMFDLSKEAVKGITGEAFKLAVHGLLS